MVVRMVFSVRLSLEKIPVELFSRIKAIFYIWIYSGVEAGFCLGNRQIRPRFGHEKKPVVVCRFASMFSFTLLGRSACDPTLPYMGT